MAAPRQRKASANICLRDAAHRFENPRRAPRRIWRRCRFVVAYLANWLLGTYSARHAQAPRPSSVLASSGVLPCGMQAQPIRFLESTGRRARNSPSDQFLSLMNAGKNYLDQGDATNALAIYKQAEAIVPNDADVRLNLANSYLANGAAEEAIREADEVLKLDPNSAAAYFVKGVGIPSSVEPGRSSESLGKREED